MRILEPEGIRYLVTLQACVECQVITCAAVQRRLKRFGLHISERGAARVRRQLSRLESQGLLLRSPNPGRRKTVLSSGVRYELTEHATVTLRSFWRLVHGMLEEDIDPTFTESMGLD